MAGWHWDCVLVVRIGSNSDDLQVLIRYSNFKQLAYLGMMLGFLALRFETLINVFFIIFLFALVQRNEVPSLSDEVLHFYFFRLWRRTITVKLCTAAIHCESPERYLCLKSQSKELFKTSTCIKGKHLKSYLSINTFLSLSLFPLVKVTSSLMRHHSIVCVTLGKGIGVSIWTLLLSASSPYDMPWLPVDGGIQSKSRRLSLKSPRVSTPFTSTTHLV